MNSLNTLVALIAALACVCLCVSAIALPRDDDLEAERGVSLPSSDYSIHSRRRRAVEPPAMDDVYKVYLPSVGWVTNKSLGKGVDGAKLPKFDYYSLQHDDPNAKPTDWAKYEQEKAEQKKQQNRGMGFLGHFVRRS